MSIRIHRCITIVCDSCGATAENDDIGTPHYETLDDAVKSLAGDGDDEDFTHEWLMAPTEHVCPSCRATRACATVGHDWDPEWRSADMRGVPVRYRWCWRCSEREIAPVVTSS